MLWYVAMLCIRKVLYIYEPTDCYLYTERKRLFPNKVQKCYGASNSSLYGLKSTFSVSMEEPIVEINKLSPLHGTKVGHAVWKL